MPAATYDLIKDLPLSVDGYELESKKLDVTSGFGRYTTTIHLKGKGEVGLGEDVTYEEDLQLEFQNVGAVHDLSGDFTLETFSKRLDELDFFPTAPDREVYRNYRRWAFESAALDLALRQAGTSLDRALQIEAQPVRFVTSLRLEMENPTLAPIKRLLDKYPTTRFKLDPTENWDRALVGQLVEVNAVDVFDLKGQYGDVAKEGISQVANPELYELIANAFPHAIIEDPQLTEETERILEPHRRRVSWDAPIHSVADIKARPFPPDVLNIKPSRFGPIKELFATYDYCKQNGIQMYGGGQFELGVGRGQIEYLASLFHGDSPNDVAPAGYHVADVGDGLPTSPMDPKIDGVGFRWK